MGINSIPEEYYDCFVCDTLKITLEELNKQDNDWVVRMITYITQKNKAEEHRQKSANSKH